MKSIFKHLRILFLTLSLAVMAFAITSCGDRENPPEDTCTHEWGAWETVAEATCASEGSEKRFCTKEGCDGYEERSIEKLAHVYSDTLSSDALQHWRECSCGAITEAADHSFSSDFKTDDYSHWHECVCGAKSEVAAHNFDNGTVKTPASCTAAGVLTKTCTDCEFKVDSEISKLAHSFDGDYTGDANGHWKECSCGEKSHIENHEWDEGEITTPSTCVTQGVKTFTCTVCDETKTEDIPLSAHDFTDVAYSSDENSHWKKCKNCTATTGNGDHAWGDGVVTTAPTCTTAGVRTFTCATCEKTKTEAESKLNHDFDYDTPIHNDTDHWFKCKDCEATTTEENHEWGEGVVTTEPTCTADGVKTFTCDCGTTKTEKVDRLPHDFTDVAYSSDDNSHWKKCKNCTATTGNGDHAWDDGVVTTAPTCTTEGVRTFTCATCEKTKTAVEPKLSHDFTDVAYSYDDNSHWLKCKNCDETASHASHSGGSANCSNKAVCETCNQAYGEIDSTKHNGGSATCTERAICSDCNLRYGSYNASVHSNTVSFTYEKLNGENHNKKYSCCGHSELEAHSGGTASCTEQAKCQYCKAPYGEIIPTNHIIKKVDKKDSTCDEVGHEEYWECRSCGATFADADCTDEVDVAELVIAAKGHNYEETSSYPATCTADGAKVSTCTRCGDVVTETLTAPGHDMEYSESHSSEATCEKVGYKYNACSVCGETELVEELPLIACNEELISDVESTCYSQGYKTYKCSMCFEERTEKLPFAPHDYVDTVVEVGCTSDGYTLHKCSREECGYEYTSDTVECQGHNYEVIENITVTCTSDGKTVEKCSECGDEIITTYDALGHDDVSATCESDAVCSKCNTVIEAALGHAFEGGAIVNDVLPTCTADGYQEHRCTRCTATELVTPNGYNKTGHATNVWEEVVEHTAACTFKRTLTSKCDKCDEIVTKEETYTNHVLTGKLTVLPTCQKPGTMTYTCECGVTNYDDADYYPSMEEGKEVDYHNWQPVSSALSENGEEVNYTHKCITEGCTATKTVVDASSGISAEQIQNADKVQTGDAELAFNDSAKNNLSGNITISAGKLNVSDLAESVINGLDKEILNRINDTNGILSLEATDANGNFIGNEENGGFGGVVTVKIPYELQEGDDPNEIVVWYFDNEKLVPMKAIYTEIDGQGYATFETTHFSYYTVTRMTPAERCGLYGCNWGEEITTPATCLEKGYTVRNCKRCNVQEIVSETDALGHEFVEGVTVGKTCTENGYTEYVCERNCGASYRIVDKATGHNNVCINTVPSTCETAGYEEYKCANDGCTHSFTKPLSKAAHSYELVDSKTASCVEAGYEKYECSVCHREDYRNHKPATGHSILHKIVLPTCETEGYTENWCEICKAQFAKTDITPFTGHEWDRDEPDCENDKKCKHCQKLDDNGKRKGHFLEDGTCKFCQKDLAGECLNDHSDIANLIKEQTVPSTCATYGYTQYVCKDCKKKVRIESDTLAEHSYKFFKETEATCFDPAYTVELCQFCNDEKKTEVADSAALGHDFVGSSCSRCGTPAETFYLNMLETWCDVDGFALVISDFSFKMYQQMVGSNWMIEGEMALVDVAELMLYVDENGKLQGAAHGSIRIYNGPVPDAWAQMGMKAVIDGDACYLYIYTDIAGEKAESYATLNLADLLSDAFGEMNLSPEMISGILGFVSERILPIITSFKDANAAEIDALLESLVNLVFSTKLDGEKVVYFLDYNKIREINDDLLYLTIEEFVDKHFGVGAYDDLCGFILEVAGLKISEIPAFAESIGLDVDAIALLVNELCAMMGAPEGFDILEAIKDDTIANVTVGEMIGSMMGGNGGGNSGEPDSEVGGGVIGGTDMPGANPPTDNEEYKPDMPVDKEEEYIPALMSADAQNTSICDMLSEMFGFIGENTVYSLFGAQTEAAEIHGMVNDVIDMLEKSIYIGLTVDSTGKILDYEIKFTDFSFEPDENDRVEISFTINIMPDCRLDIDLSDVVQIAKDKTALPELEDGVESEIEYEGGFDWKEGISYNGEYYEAYVSYVNMFVDELNRSKVMMISYNNQSCGGYDSVTLTYFVNRNYVYLCCYRITVDGEDIYILRNDGKDGGEIVVTMSEGNYVFSLPSGEVVTVNPNESVDYRSFIPSDWWKSNSSTNAEYMLYNPETQDIIYDAINPHDYVLDEEKSRPANGCIAGYEAYVCTVCGDVVERYVEDYGAEHSYVLDYDKSEIAASCTQTSIYTFTCTVCGDSYERSMYVGHDYIVSSDLKAGAIDCEGGVVYTKICSVCGHIGESSVSYGHRQESVFTYVGGKVFMRNTCYCGEFGSSGKIYFDLDTNLDLTYVGASNNHYYDGQYVYFSFVAETSGVYEFYSAYNNNMLYLNSQSRLYNAAFELISEGEAGGFDKGNFAMASKLTEGETYYLSIKVNGDIYNEYFESVYPTVYARVCPEPEVIDLSAYGCDCGGTMIITEIFGIRAAEFELNCDAEDGVPCSVCGFTYQSFWGESGTEEKSCEINEFLYYLIGTPDAEPVKIVIYDRPSGKANHWTESVEKFEELYDGDKLCGYKRTVSQICRNGCEKIFSMTVEEIRVNSNGNPINVKTSYYKFDNALSELILDYVEEYAFIEVLVSGRVENIPTSYKKSYYDGDTVYFWQMMTYVYGSTVCEVTINETDSVGYVKVRSFVDHQKEWKELPDEYEEIIGEDGVTVVSVQEYYCSKCGASFRKHISKRFYNIDGVLIKEIDEYYDHYVNSENEYGYQLSEIRTVNYGSYEYKPGKLGIYTLSENYEYYNENGSISHSGGLNYEYPYGNYCEYIAYNVNDGVQNNDNYHTGCRHLGEQIWDCTLSADADSCLDGLEYLWIYECCGESHWAGSGHKPEGIDAHQQQHSSEQMIDLSSYSDCGGYLLVYTCPCGDRTFVNTENVNCDLYMETLIAIWGWNEEQTKSDHFKYKYSCAVTHDASGENICGFSYTHEWYDYIDENCNKLHHEEWVFTSADGEQFTYSYDCPTGEVLHLNENQSLKEDPYYDGDYKVYVSGWKNICRRCNHISEEYIYRNYFVVNEENEEQVKQITEHIYYYDDVDQKSSVNYYIDEWYDGPEGGKYGQRTFESYTYYSRDGINTSYQENVTSYKPFYSSDGKFIYVKDRIEYSYINYIDHNSEGYTQVYEYFGCPYNYMYMTTYTSGRVEEYFSNHNDWRYNWGEREYWISEPTCTQNGIGCFACRWCDYTECMEEGRFGHSFNWDGEKYVCYNCGLENATGNDGSISLEDLTSDRGNGTDYVIGYYNRNEKDEKYEIVVQVLFADGDSIRVNGLAWDDGNSIIMINIADLLAYLKENGYEVTTCDFELSVSLVPEGASLFDYAIIITPHIANAEKLMVDGNVIKQFDETCRDCGEVIKDGITVTVNSEYALEYSLKDNEENIILYAFTPTESGNYCFYSSDNSSDTYGHLFDEYMNCINSDDDSNGDGNFYVLNYLEAGVTYYFGSRMYSEETTSGNYTVNLVKCTEK